MQKHTSINILVIGFLLMVSLLSLACSAEEHKNGAPKRPTTFEECVAAGFPVTRSIPPSCLGGQEIFTQKVDSVKLPDVPTVRQAICKDQCGNGSCEEIVCMAEGCPCPETSENCPQDCSTH